MRTILFICTGNTCRSPMAVGLVKKELKNDKDVNVLSAGVMAADNGQANIYAVKVMIELGINISGHRTKQMTQELIERADLVFVMTQVHKLEVVNMLEKPGKQIYLIREFNKEILGSKDLDIPDPIGRPIEVYRKCRDEIKKCVPGIVKKILEK